MDSDKIVEDFFECLQVIYSTDFEQHFIDTNLAISYFKNVLKDNPEIKFVDLVFNLRFFLQIGGFIEDVDTANVIIKLIEEDCKKYKRL